MPIARPFKRLVTTSDSFSFPTPRGFDHINQSSVIDRNGVVYSQVYGVTFELPWLVEPLKEIVFNRPSSVGHVFAGLIDQVKLFCTVFDPATGRYRFDNSLFVQIAVGASMILAIIIYLLREILRSRRAKKQRMIERIHRSGRALFGLLRRPMARAFESAENPLNHIGAMTVFFLWIVLVSGIWLLIFFRTSVSGAFESVEYLTREQWYLGGIMRSLHRYASDAAIVTMLLHIVKEFVFNRYRNNRWFTWVTGVPLVWMMFVLGITGYWLVWDELAQYVAISSAELIDSIPIFTDSMAGNFLSDDLLSNRFFTLMAFLHLIGLPIFLVFGIWLHVFRLNSPRINPPRRMMAATLLAMLILSAVFPAISHEQADLAMTPQVLKTRLVLSARLSAYPDVVARVGLGSAGGCQFDYRYRPMGAVAEERTASVGHARLLQWLRAMCG